MEFCALSSGSSGNSYYIENNNKAILIDCGLSAKRIIERLKYIQKNPNNIKAILITHEHQDHIRGALVFGRHFNIPIYATKGTIKSSLLCSDSNLIKVIRNDESLSLCGMDISVFPKSHSASDPVFFSIKNKKEISIITDLGYSTRCVNEAIKNSDFLCIESNHDLKLLEDGRYPQFLKKWITGDKGHLSNEQSVASVFENATNKLKNIVLSHLSINNNKPDLALKAFGQLKNRKEINCRISISERHIPTKLFKV